MREIDSNLIEKTIERMCIQANCVLPEDVRSCIECAGRNEPYGPARLILQQMIENYHIAEEDMVPICQDTGAACVFLEIGQDVHITGSIEDAVNRGVAAGYTNGYLRASMVSDPITRVNTGNNTPAFIYYDMVPGDKVKITVAPKGFGSENMSRIKMLKPSDGVDGIIDFVMEAVTAAGPVVVGIGIGGNFDKAALMSKKALLRPLDQPKSDDFYGKLEQKLLEMINATGMGPQGFGGKTYALAVNIEHAATHIAGLPAAVNINCHVSRHCTEVL